MFTNATQSFGNWRENHSSARFSHVAGGLSLLIALGMCAFVCWIIFIIAIKIRSEFFVLENNPLVLHRISGVEGFLNEARPSALTLGVVPDKEKQLRLLFSHGEVFLFPRDKTKIESVIKKRIDEMVLTGLVTMIATPAISRVQIWPAADVSETNLKDLLDFFVRIGFDDFDFAIEVD